MLKKRVRGFAPEAQALLTAYAWPGNVRELRNVVERALILCPHDMVGPAYLPAEIQGLPSAPIPLPDAAAAPDPGAPAQVCRCGINRSHDVLCTASAGSLRM